MRTEAQRIAAYIAKYVPTTVGLKVAAQLVDMKAGHTGFVNDIQPIEVAIGTELDTADVPGIDRAMYFAFGRQLWKVSRLYADPALTSEAQAITDKWEARGLATLTLIAIALNVFGITVT